MEETGESGKIKENTRALNEFIRVKYLLCFTGIGQKEHIEGRGGVDNQGWSLRY